MNTEFHQDEVQFLLQEFSNKGPNILTLDKTDDDSKNLSSKEEDKTEVNATLLSLNIFQAPDQKIEKKSQFLLGILEIGHNPSLFFKKYPYPAKKYFWYIIMEKNANIKKMFQNYAFLTPIKLKELYLKYENLNNISFVVETIKEFQDDIDNSSLE